MPIKKIKKQTSSVKIPKEMKEAIELFLETPKAKDLGFNAISDVTTAAVRDLLEKYRYYESKEY